AADGLVLDDQLAVVAAFAEEADDAGEVEVALVERGGKLAVAVADLALLLAEFGRVADALDVGVDGAGGVLAVDLVDGRERVPEPVPVADVEGQAEARIVHALQDAVHPGGVVPLPPVVLDPKPDGAARGG